MIAHLIFQSGRGCCFVDVRVDVDYFLAADKIIIGPPTWSIAPRPNIRIMKRSLLLEGEAIDAFLHCQAFPRTQQHEFRHLIVYAGKCVARLDFAPSEDGAHLNALSCPFDYPTGKVDHLHYHDWAANRQFGNGKALPNKLPCARVPEDRIVDIDQGFWWFCHQNNI